MKNVSYNKSFFISISVLFLLLLGGVLFLANVQKQQSTTSSAGVNSVQIQCSQTATIDLAFSFTNDKSYAVDLVAEFSDDLNDPIAEISNIPPGETRNGIVDTGKVALPAGNLFVTSFPSDENSTQQPEIKQKPFTALTCGTPSSTVAPTSSSASPSASPTSGAASPTGSSASPTASATAAPIVTINPTVTIPVIPTSTNAKLNTVLVCSPTSLSLSTASKQLTAFLGDEEGRRVAGKAVTWSALNASVVVSHTSQTDTQGKAASNALVPPNAVTPFVTNVTATFAGDSTHNASSCTMQVQFQPGGSSSFPGSSTVAKELADLNDDGFVNQFDYNLFIREISTQPGS